MPDIVISVRGEARRRVAPELAVVHAAAVAEGPARDVVSAEVASSAAAVQGLLAELADTGAVVDWSSGSVSIWSEHPWTGDASRSDLVHHAAVDLSATFADRAALSTWVGAVTAIDGIRISGIEWLLRDETRSQIERDVAAAAVAKAVARASAFGAAVGRSSVEAVQIADTGLLTGIDSPPDQPMFARAAAMSAADGGTAVDLRPADIVVASTVEARFVAR